MFSNSSESDASHTHVVDTKEHNMQTRLQTSAISRKNYAAFLAFCPQLTSLQLLDSIYNSSHDIVSGGFTFVADIYE